MVREAFRLCYQDSHDGGMERGEAMSDINIGICPICRQQFDLSDGVPCDCVEREKEEKEDVDVS
jgi:hypothetical protein